MTAKNTNQVPDHQLVNLVKTYIMTAKTEKKKFTFRYDKGMEDMLDKGHKMYRSEAKVNKLSMQQLIDICIEKAVVAYPEEIKLLKGTIRELEESIRAIEVDRSNISAELESIKVLLQKKFDIESKLYKIVKDE